MAGTPSDASTPNAAGAPPTVAFDSKVSFSGPFRGTLTGTVSDSAGVKGVELFDGSVDLGAATIKPDGHWRFVAVLGPGLHDGLTAVATGQDGQTASAASPYTLTTGIKGQPYTTEQDIYNASGTAVGNTFFGRLGSVYLADTIATTPQGGMAVTYSGGDYFAGKPFSSFTDSYGPAGMLTTHVENNKNGSHTIVGFQDGLVINSISNDTITGGGFNERFVFTPVFGHDTITDFQVRGFRHDTVVLPSSASTHLAQIINGARMSGGNTTLQLTGQDSITLQGVTKAELRAHPNDFRFHA